MKTTLLQVNKHTLVVGPSMSGKTVFATNAVKIFPGAVYFSPYVSEAFPEGLRVVRVNADEDPAQDIRRTIQMMDADVFVLDGLIECLWKGERPYLMRLLKGYTPLWAITQSADPLLVEAWQKHRGQVVKMEKDSWKNR